MFLLAAKKYLYTFIIKSPSCKINKDYYQNLQLNFIWNRMKKPNNDMILIIICQNSSDIINNEIQKT